MLLQSRSKHVVQLIMGQVAIGQLNFPYIFCYAMWNQSKNKVLPVILTIFYLVVVVLCIFFITRRKQRLVSLNREKKPMVNFRLIATFFQLFTSCIFVSFHFITIHVLYRVCAIVFILWRGIIKKKLLLVKHLTLLLHSANVLKSICCNSISADA